MGIGIGLGFFVGAVALGLTNPQPQAQLNFQTAAWWIVVITTLLPIGSYLENRLLLSGPWGGFISGLGTGLGFFLLVAGKIGV
jgi:hypothetical protein